MQASLIPPLFYCNILASCPLLHHNGIYFFAFFYFVCKRRPQSRSARYIGQGGGAIDAGQKGTHYALLSDYHNKRHTTRVPYPFSFTSVVYEFMMRAMFFGSLEMKRKRQKAEKNIDIPSVLPLCKLFRMNVGRVLLGFNIFSDPRRNLQLTKLNPEYSCLECGPVGAAAAIWHRRR